MPARIERDRKSSSPACEHLYWLDWLRFIAAFMVVAIHARGGTWVEWGRLTEGSQTIPAVAFFAITRAGAECVLVFFVLSGFLVGGKVIERLADRSFNLRSYVIDRFTRIWIPLVPALLWSAAVAGWVGKPISWTALAGNLAGLQCVLVRSFAENVPLWSLAYEIWFYFLAGSLSVWILGGIRARILSGFAVCLGFAVFTKLETVFLFSWIIGAAAYHLSKRPRMPLLATAGVLLVVAGYVFSQLRTATVSVDTTRWLRYAPSSKVATLILSSGLAVVLPFLTQLKPRSNLAVSINKLGSTLAAFSYTLYLTHYPALYVWEHYLPERHRSIDATSIIWYSLRILSCIVFAWLCYLPFERHTGRIRKWLRNRFPAPFPKHELK